MTNSTFNPTCVDDGSVNEYVCVCMCMCMYVCVCVCMNIRMYVHIYVSVGKLIGMDTHDNQRSVRANKTKKDWY